MGLPPPEATTPPTPTQPRAPISGTLTFANTAAGSQTFTVSTTEDTIDEGTGETFTVTLSNPAGGGGPSPSLSTSPSVTTTITDDDTASGIALSASPSTLGEDDAETSATVTDVTATLNGGTEGSDAEFTPVGHGGDHRHSFRWGDRGH